MSRVSVLSIDAGHEFFAGAMTLWVARQREFGSSERSTGRAATEGRLARALTGDGVRLFAAHDGRDVVGYALTFTRAASCLTTERSLVVEELYVDTDHRRVGVARHLLAAVCSYAERAGVGLLECSAPAQDKSANRFLARLGFGSPQVRRSASAPLLLRRITGEDSGALAIVQRRRHLRAREHHLRPEVA